jgi:hypothetical protein
LEHFEVYSHNFLLIRYDNMDFLIDRNQFSGSTSLDELFPVRSGFPYLNYWGWYNRERLLMFDMNRYLTDLFQCRQLGGACLCLIMRIQDFQQQGQDFLKSLLKQSEKLSQNYFGLIISSQAEIQSLSLTEFFLSPQGIRSLLEKRGVYGCRFPEEEHIQFFIDLQKYLFYALEPQTGRRNAHTAD